MNCLWLIEQTVFKPFTMKICEVIWIIFVRQGPEKGTFLLYIWTHLLIQEFLFIFTIFYIVE